MPDPSNIPLYVSSVKALCEHYDFTSPRTMEEVVKLPGFPRERVDNHNYRYPVVKCLLWMSANPKALRHTYLDQYRVPELQKEYQAKDNKPLIKEKEQARLLKAQADRTELKLEVEKGELVKTSDRDADEIERLAILKRRLYETANSESANLLTKTDITGMTEGAKLIIDKALSQAQDDWTQINSQLDDIYEPPSESPEAHLNEEERIDYPDKPPALENPPQI